MKSYSVTAFGKPLEELEQPIPAPSGAEVVVKVKAAGICHSDIHIWEGGYDLGHGRRLSLADRGMKLPLTLGHETAGEAIACGPEAHGIEIGQNYLVYPWIGCGECEVCLSGAENYCLNACNIGVNRDGGYAEYVLVPHARYLVPIGDLDPAELAPYACSGVTVYSALKKFGETIKRHPLVVIGAGGLGHMAVGILKALAGRGAIVVDIDPVKRDAALAAGALAAIDVNARDAIAQIHQAVGGPCYGALDLVGSPQTAELGFNCLTRGGTLVLVGLFGGAAPWPLPLIATKAVNIMGSLVGNLQETRELVELVRAGGLGKIPITRLPLENANDALMGLREGKFVGRAVLCPGQAVSS
ncbi:MAG TPA: alcohol dehydrogenase [Alphaproteobacteria bacterium]|nr:alcohol dehydrogenase [Alphaproteobacteria bacterium]